MTKGILYYTDNQLEGIKVRLFNREVMPWVQENLLKMNLPITSVSLKPIDFGRNIVLGGRPCAYTMTQQILAGLEAMTEDYIFFCEHDILYHPSHFDIDNIDNNTFYYNLNGYKWDYRNDHVVFHNDMKGLYGLSANRKKLVLHYRLKIKIIEERGYHKLPVSRYPRWIREMAYEPGKPIRHGGIADDKVITWMSKYPNINIRHRRNATPPKMTLESFIRKPTEWVDSTLDKVPGWDFKY